MKTYILVAGTLALAASKASAYDPASVWDWKVRPAVGSRYVMRTYTRSEADSQVDAGTKPAKPQDIKVTTIQNVTYDQEILGRDALGATTIKLTYRSYDTTISMKGPGFNPDISSNLKKSKPAMDKAYLGASFTLKVAPDGKVWSIVGLDKLRARLTDAFNKQYGAMFGSSVGSQVFAKEETYKDTFSQLYGGLPLHPVSTGDSWPYALRVPGNLGLQNSVEGTRQLVARNDGIATVKENSVFNVTEEIPLPKTASGFRSGSVQLQGTWKKALSVNEASGLVRESNTSMVYKGSTVMAFGGTSAPASPITVAMSGRVVSHTVLEPAS